MRQRTALALMGALILSACGAAVAEDDAASPPALGVCAPGVTDCVDTVVDDGGDDADGDEWDDTFGADAARDEAERQLGLTEDELDPSVRIGRVGDEHYMLTEDYVLGRITVELEADETGTYRVVVATVELPDGPETYS